MARRFAYRLGAPPVLAAVLALAAWCGQVPAQAQTVPWTPAPALLPPPDPPPLPNGLTFSVDRHTLRVLEPHFRPDGHAAVLLGQNDRVELFDLEARRRVRTCYFPLPAACRPQRFAAAVSGDSRRLAVVPLDVCERPCTWVYNLDDGHLIACLPLGPIDPETEPERLFGNSHWGTWMAEGARLQFSADGGRLGVSECGYRGWGPVFTLWDTEARRCLARVPLHEHRGNTAALSPDGDYLLADVLKGTAVLWRLTGGPPAWSPTPVEGSWFVWSPDGRSVLGQAGTPDAPIPGKPGCRSVSWPPADDRGQTAFSSDSRTVLSDALYFPGQHEPAAEWDGWYARHVRFSLDGCKVLGFGSVDSVDRPPASVGLAPLDDLSRVVVNDADSGKPLACYGVPLHDEIRHTAVSDVRWGASGPVLDWDDRDETFRPDPARGSGVCHPTVTRLTPPDGWRELAGTDDPGPLVASRPYEMQYCTDFWRAPDGVRWVGYTDDNLVRLGRSLPGNEYHVDALVSLLALDDWVAWTPAGDFAGTPKGGARLRLVTWRNGVATAVEAASVRSRHYRPDVLRRVLAAR